MCLCDPLRSRRSPHALGAAAPTRRRASLYLDSVEVDQAVAPARLAAQDPYEASAVRKPWASMEEDMKLADREAKMKLLRRVRRIEGQARGVARMIEEDRDCGEILQQLAAVRSAAHQATIALVRSYATECVVSDASAEEIADALAVALSRLA